MKQDWENAWSEVRSQHADHPEVWLAAVERLVEYPRQAERVRGADIAASGLERHPDLASEDAVRSALLEGVEHANDRSARRVVEAVRAHLEALEMRSDLEALYRTGRPPASGNAARALGFATQDGPSPGEETPSDPPDGEDPSTEGDEEASSLPPHLRRALDRLQRAVDTLLSTEITSGNDLREASRAIEDLDRRGHLRRIIRRVELPRPTHRTYILRARSPTIERYRSVVAEHLVRRETSAFTRALRAVANTQTAPGRSARDILEAAGEW